MRALLQRVRDASVTVEGKVIGQIEAGLVIFVCAMPGDSETVVEALAAKIAKLRVFKDAAGKMNRSLLDTGGAALVISQFTLAADTRRGNRPGFSGVLGTEKAEKLYLHFAATMRDLGPEVATGQFGAEMSVALTNDGPVTIWLDTENP